MTRIEWLGKMREALMKAEQSGQIEYSKMETGEEYKKLRDEYRELRRVEATTDLVSLREQEPKTC